MADFLIGTFSMTPASVPSHGETWQLSRDHRRETVEFVKDEDGSRDRRITALKRFTKRNHECVAYFFSVTVAVCVIVLCLHYKT